jgi:hypothetical protein
MTEEQTQKELVDKVLQACESKDIKKINSLIKLIDFHSFYHKSNISAQQIFAKACLRGNLDIIETLIPLTRLYKDDNNSVMNYAFERLIQSNDEKHYPIITHLMNRPKLQANRCRDFFSAVSWGLKFAARRDNANLFKVLLNFNQTKKNNTWFFESLGIYTYACEHKNEANVIRYIFTEPLLVNYVNEQMGFLRACEYKNIKVLEFFIFEYNIEKNVVFTDPNADTYKEAIRMFNLRDLNGDLNINLPQNKDLSKKTKV